MPTSLTELRSNIYKLIDDVLATGQPLEIERHGKTLLISPCHPPSKFESLVDRKNVIEGDPEDLVHVDWTSEWSPGAE